MVVETLKFVEEHTGKVFSDLQRLTLTVILLYVAAPKQAQLSYNQALQSFASVIAQTKGFFPNEIKSQTLLLISSLILFWIIYQAIIALHQSLLTLVQHLLPNIFFRVGLVNRRLSEMNHIKNFGFKYFSKHMQRDDFDTLMNLYIERIFGEVAGSAEYSSDHKMYIKERIFLFIITLWWSGEFKPLQDLVLLGLLILFAYYNGMKRHRDTFALALVQRAAWDLISPRLDHNINHSTKSSDEVCIEPSWMAELDIGVLHIDIFDWIFHCSIFGWFGEINLRKNQRNIQIS